MMTIPNFPFPEPDLAPTGAALDIEARKPRQMFDPANGTEWWWESNRKLPINIFIGKKFDKFKVALKTFSSKDCIVEFGPITRLSDLTKDKRIRRKTIQLVRRVK